MVAVVGCNAVTFAFNELESLLKKAAIGAGFSVGHAMAIASAGVWLGRRGFPVCDIVCRAIAGGPRESVMRSVNGDMVFEAARVGVDGVAGIDLLLAGLARDVVTLEGLDEPRLLVGLAGMAASAPGMSPRPREVELSRSVERSGTNRARLARAQMTPASRSSASFSFE